jgi:hypothetical protein
MYGKSSGFPLFYRHGMMENVKRLGKGFEIRGKQFAQFESKSFAVFKYKVYGIELSE